MDGDGRDGVMLLRDGQTEWQINGLNVRMSTAETCALAAQALGVLAWNPGMEKGLEYEGHVRLMSGDRQLRDEIERLRAAGKAKAAKVLYRLVLMGPWDENEPAALNMRPGFIKTPLYEPQSKPARRAAKPAPKVHGDPSIDVQLFADPEEQLRYEVRHAYLMTVPISQRKQWPLGEYCLLPQFLVDTGSHGGQVSRAQIIAAIVDVVSTRIIDVNSRQPRVLRQGGGETNRPSLIRSDGASAWRANVTVGAAARRIMWWRTPAGVIELARVSTHDDFDMPER